jgi:elongation factor P hydroxylase
MGQPVSCQSETFREFCPRRLERVFVDCFYRDYLTLLVGGAREPLYQPASEVGGIHRIHYREDYFASALHEVAHWCIAGERRRELTDFGYWYSPDGRTAEQQRAFERVECKPQALEWHFARACGYRFRISVDNLDGLAALPDGSGGFRRQVLQQARHWQSHGLPERARRFTAALRREFSPAAADAPFTLAELG